jgi:hypothetical protein
MAEMTDADDSVHWHEQGIFRGFEGYFVPQDSDYREALLQGLVALDTNVLLNLYRYTSIARQDLFSAMEQFGNRLWVPHQVMWEFWRGREAVLRNPRGTADTIQELESHKEKTGSVLRTWLNRAAMDDQTVQRLVHQVNESYESLERAIRELAEDEVHDYARDTATDPVLRSLDHILAGKIGTCFSEAEENDAQREGERRIEEKLPPGYKDRKKGDDNATGDYRVWHQLLKEARSRQVGSVVLVTGDVKDDWWRKEGGEFRGPRVELVNEILQYSGAKLFFLRPTQLLKYSRDLFNINVRPGSVKNIDVIDNYYSDENSVDLLELTPTEFEHLVRQLLEALGSVTYTTRLAPGADAVMINPKFGAGLTIVQIKQYLKPVGAEQIRDLIGAIEMSKAERGLLITTSWFTQAAKAVARDHGKLELVDGNMLVYLIRVSLGRTVRIGRPPEKPTPGEDESQEDKAAGEDESS